MKIHVDRKRVLQSMLLVLATATLFILARHYSRGNDIGSNNKFDFNEITINMGEFPDIRISHEEEITIPGMEEEYEFLLLADLHLVINESEDAGVYGNANERIAFFSNPQGTPSAEHLPQWVAYANQQQFDAVLMDGDIIDYYTDETAEYLWENMQAFEMPYVFTLGNHELFSPWSEPIPEDSRLYDLFVNRFTAFQMLEFADFRICAIDNNEYQVNPTSYEMLKAVIDEDSEKPIILLAHVPFYTEQDRELLEKSINTWGQALVIGSGEGTRDTTSISRDFIDLILAEESPVVAIFTGDNHFYHKGELADGVTQWIIEPAFAGNGMILRVKGN